MKLRLSNSHESAGSIWLIKRLAVVASLSLMILLFSNTKVLAESIAQSLSNENRLTNLNYESDLLNFWGDIRPIPWGYELPFPWDNISGVWRARHGDDGNFFTYFDFNIVRESHTGERQLSVRQIDFNTCQVVAKGVGREWDKVVDVFMSTIRGGAYSLRIRSFSSKDYPIRPDQGMINNGKVVLMSAAPLDAPQVMSHYQLGRVIPSNFRTNCGPR